MPRPPRCRPVPVDDAPPATAALAPRRDRGDVLDFSDYLTLRRRRDAGDASEETRALLAWLEERLPVPFARAIPHLVTLEDASEPPPRDLTREAVRVMFAMREELASHGRTREGLHLDLPEGRALKAWLDFMETERRVARQVRGHVRELDAKIWTVFAGGRRPMPSVPAPRAAPAAPAEERAR